MELIKIGKTGKTHGLKGHLKVHIDEFYLNDFMDMKIIFIDKLPYFILNKDINHTQQAILLLEDVDSKEKAHRLQGKEIFAKDDDLTEILDEETHQYLIGFELHDKTLGKIGKIENIIEMPFQIMAVIINENKEILIPLNEDFILNVNEKQKKINMQLPEGLLDVF